MASKQLAPVAVLFLVSALMLAGKGAAECNGHSVCSPFEMPPCANSVDCRCVPWALFAGQCIHPNAMPAYEKKIEEHPNLCQADADCLRKGSGNHCARYPNPHIQHGWCIADSIGASFLDMVTAAAN